MPYIGRLEPYGLTLVEQPIPRDDIAGLAAIRRAIHIPLMADESVTGPASLIEIIRREAADIVKVKVMKQGGLLRTRQMIDCAAAAGLRVVMGHGFGLTLSTLAEAAVAATSDAVIPGCEAVGPLEDGGRRRRRPGQARRRRAAPRRCARAGRRRSIPNRSSAIASSESAVPRGAVAAVLDAVQPPPSAL